MRHNGSADSIVTLRDAVTPLSSGKGRSSGGGRPANPGRPDPLRQRPGPEGGHAGAGGLHSEDVHGEDQHGGGAAQSAQLARRPRRQRRKQQQQSA